MLDKLIVVIILQYRVYMHEIIMLYSSKTNTILNINYISVQQRENQKYRISTSTPVVKQINYRVRKK